MALRSSLTIAGLVAALALAGCSASTEGGVSGSTSQIFTSEYGSVTDSGYSIPAVPISKIDKKYHRQIVSYNTRERPGTIIVDTPKRFLYFVLPGKKAVRYGIGVGKAGFAWEGEAYIAWKQEGLEFETAAMQHRLGVAVGLGTALEHQFEAAWKATDPCRSPAPSADRPDRRRSGSTTSPCASWFR
jgi:lipoprotein-anchoring transpeptidase ErfK/SrfK